MTKLKNKDKIPPPDFMVTRLVSGKVGGSRDLILIIEPPNLVTVWERGRRKGFTLTVESIYYLAAKAAEPESVEGKE